ncbi:MAG: response regulator, partial [Candidatus Aminicenantes bacterium]|nr:response regulator [Candidatus Aminicenantes bacterium]
MNELIAILEDDPDIRKLIKVTLEKEGFKTVEFDRGDNFLKYISSSSYLPDMIILDLMLPDLDGLEICKKLRSGKNTYHLPIIIVSARGEELDRVLGLELGADDYITKPFSTRELVARIKATL